MDKNLSSPQLTKYLKAFQANPTSKVFAPLAETYRKMGMIEEAFSVLSQGLKHHPNYTTGILSLASCYFDLKEFEKVYKTLGPIVNENLDNILLQKLYAKACQKIGYMQEALETFKYLLFINPKDKEVIEEAKRLEDLYGKSLTRSEEREERPAEEDKSFNEDSWVQVDFSNESQAVEKKSDLRMDSGWKMKKESPFDDPEAESEVVSPEPPVITHTLVDLYLEQKHYKKAIDVLEKIYQLNPEDQKTLRKLEEVRHLVEERAASKITREKDEGRDNLMKLFDSKFSRKETSGEILTKKFNLFLDRIKEHSRLTLLKSL